MWHHAVWQELAVTAALINKGKVFCIIRKMVKTWRIVNGNYDTTSTRDSNHSILSLSLRHVHTCIYTIFITMVTGHCKTNACKFQRGVLYLDLNFFISQISMMIPAEMWQI